MEFRLFVIAPLLSCQQPVWNNKFYMKKRHVRKILFVLDQNLKSEDGYHLTESYLFVANTLQLSMSHAMDTLLIDIKNFLKKLENGQLDIEAGQWELHKDIVNMKRSVEELKKLKEDVEVMKMNNAEQMGVIRNLEAKLEYFRRHFNNDEPVTVSESSYETVYRIPVDGQQAPKGYKKRKCHVVRSEEIIEITSEISDQKSASDNEGSDSRDNSTSVRKADDDNQASDDQSSHNMHSHAKHVHIVPVQTSSKVRYQSHPPNNGILQRYLKDSAKYRDRNVSSSSDRSDVVSQSSMCHNTHKDTEYNNFWDEYSSRLPQSQTYQSRAQNMRRVSSGSTKTTESVIPRRLICPKNMKKFTFKSDFPEHERRRRMRHIYHCNVCGKGFGKKNMLRAHWANHGDISRKLKGYKCSYCDKIFSTPGKLTLHLKNCRIIMRSHFMRR